MTENSRIQASSLCCPFGNDVPLQDDMTATGQQKARLVVMMAGVGAVYFLSLSSSVYCHFLTTSPLDLDQDNEEVTRTFDVGLFTVENDAGDCVSYLKNHDNLVAIGGSYWKASRAFAGFAVIYSGLLFLLSVSMVCGVGIVPALGNNFNPCYVQGMILTAVMQALSFVVFASPDFCSQNDESCRVGGASGMAMAGICLSLMLAGWLVASAVPTTPLDEATEEEEIIQRKWWSTLSAREQKKEADEDGVRQSSMSRKVHPSADPLVISPSRVSILHVP